MKRLVLPGSDVMLAIDLPGDEGPQAAVFVMYDKNGRHVVVMDRAEQKALCRWLAQAEKHHEREDRK